MSTRLDEPGYIQCLLSSFASTRSIVLFTPKGLSQRMQQNGSSSLRTRAGALAARKSIWGLSVITFSGHVAWHSPHCTQASSMNRSNGRSGSSRNAPVGQADTQDRHNVQPPASISTAPKGAPAGNAIMSTGAGAARCSSPSAKRSTSFFLPTARKLAGRGAVGINGLARNAAMSTSGSSVSIVATQAGAKPNPASIGSAIAIIRRNPATS